MRSNARGTTSSVSLLVSAVLLLTAGPVAADWDVNLMPGVTEISREVYDLHMTIFWICVAIGTVVFGVMLYSIVYHRKSRGARSVALRKRRT